MPETSLKAKQYRLWVVAPEVLLMYVTSLGWTTREVIAKNSGLKKNI